MLTFNWMLRYLPYQNHNLLLELAKELDEVGYRSILLTVRSRASDYIPAVSRILDQDLKIKYMLAVRPYLLSPQFFMMLVSGMDTIAKDKIIINWVHGTFGTYENFDGILDMPENMEDPAVRRDHLEKFINLLSKTNMARPIEVPESLISGGNPETIKMASRLGMHLGTGYDIFLNHYEICSQYNFEKIFVQVSLLIRDTDEEALEEKGKRDLEPVNVICGSPETVEKELIKLYELGATDLLVSQSFGGEKDEMQQERKRIHDLVVSMREKGLAR